MERGGCIYIMTNYQRTTLYIGVTSDLRSAFIGISIKSIRGHLQQSKT